MLSRGDAPHSQSSNRLNSSAPLVPPKPNEFESA